VLNLVPGSLKDARNDDLRKLLIHLEEVPMRFSKFTVVLSTTATCLFASSIASAQDEPAAGGEPPPAAEPAAPPAGEAAAPAEAATPAAAAGAAAGEAPGVHEHDGFFFRIGLGIGYYIGKGKPEEVAGITPPDFDAKGIAIPGDLSFGGTVAPGLVIGGGSFGNFIPAPKFKADGGTEQDGGAMSITGIGPFVNYYLNPKEGLHLDAALLLVLASIAEKENTTAGVTTKTPKAGGIGFGAALGAGYDFWIGEQWSLGVLARVTYFTSKVTYDTTGDPKATFSGFIPGILFAATYH